MNHLENNLIILNAVKITRSCSFLKVSFICFSLVALSLEAKETSTIEKVTETIASLPQSEKICYPVSSIQIEIEGNVPDKQKLLHKLSGIKVGLAVTPLGILGKECSLPSEKLKLASLQETSLPRLFYQGALQAVAAAIAEFLYNEGYSGIAVQINPDQIDEQGKDIRSSKDFSLTFKIILGAVGKVQTVSTKGKEQYVYDKASYNYILADSPVQVGDPLYRIKLEKYSAQLNRTPHRRVDVEVHSLNEPNLIGVDFVVREARPWRVYSNIANTGTDTTGLWQETIGYSNTNVTGIDDAIRLDVVSDSFNAYFGVNGGYEVPFFRGSKGKWKLQGSYNRFTQTQFGIEDETAFRGFQTFFTGQAVYNLYSFGELFLDGFLGMNFLSIKNKTEGGVTSIGKQIFASPTLGLSLERIKTASKLFFQLDAQGSANGFLASNRSDIDLMGRENTSTSWVIFNLRGYYSQYIDPQRLANEISILVQGQYAVNYRLMPQLQAIVGGFYTVRGFPQSFAGGDQMAMIRAEYLLHIPQLMKPKAIQTGKFLGKDFKRAPAFPGDKADWDLIVRGFFDGARTIYNNSLPVLEEDKTLLGSGVGLELRIRNYIMIRGDAGFCLKTVYPILKGSSRGYLSATFSY